MLVLVLVLAVPLLQFSLLLLLMLLLPPFFFFYCGVVEDGFLCHQRKAQSNALLIGAAAWCPSRTGTLVRVNACKCP